MALELLVAIVLVLANGFFVAAEFAVARLRPTQIAEYARERRPGAKSALHAVQHIDSYLAACQLGITLSSLGLGAVGEPAFHHALEPLFGDATRVVGIGVGSAVAFSIITVLHVVLGELAPKSLAISRTAPVALALAPVLRGFYLVTRPLVDVFNGMGNLLLRPFGIPPASEAGHAPHSEDELRTLLRESRAGGLIERQEAELSERALVFGDRRVREVMRPRPEIVFVTTSDDARRVAEVATASGHTRLPLVEPDGGLDAPVGVINVKDLLPAFVHGREIDLRAIARPLARVPESALVDEVLRELRRGRKHIALVVDEHGTTVGLVTLEDILEEIVGEIEDEFDPESADLVRRVDGAVHIDGSAPVRLVAEELGLDLDEAPHEATIGGHLLELLGRVPEQGEVVDLHGVPVQVTRVGEAQVSELRVPPET
jgi:CBS domain containing-hemolysin-like protein